MTVSYNGDVASASSFGCFNKIIFKWRGSLYKLIVKELIVYFAVYAAVNIFYREVLVKNSELSDPGKWKESRETFESVQSYFYSQLFPIPLTLLLGFYVSLIAVRWWHQFSCLPCPDNVAILTSTFLAEQDRKEDDRVRLMRRTVVRYVLLAYCMVMRSVSFVAKKRFPDLRHLVDAGLLRDDELEVINSLDEKVQAKKWFLPLSWAGDLCSRAMSEGKANPQSANSLLSEIIKVRNSLTDIINYDRVSVPLVYTQVVTFIVYSYLAVALIGHQWVCPRDGGDDVGLFAALFLMIEFIFFVGWLKVAETLINPFGEDDDDFEVNQMIDRHIQVSFLIVDNGRCPELLKDRYWDEAIPVQLPYTVVAERYRKTEFEGSAEKTLVILDCDKEYGHVLHNMGHIGHQLSRVDAWPMHGGSGIYEPIYSSRHYESVRSLRRAGRFTWARVKQGGRLQKSPMGSAVNLKVKQNKKRMSKLGSLTKAGVKNMKQGSPIGNDYIDIKIVDCQKPGNADKILETITENKNSPHATQTSLDNYFNVEGLDVNESKVSTLKIFQENEKGEVLTKIPASKFVGKSEEAEQTENNPKGGNENITFYKRRYFYRK